MSNRYAIHLETPAGLQFDGMVKADSLYEAASKWAWDLDRDVPRGAAIVVQDPNYNEETKLRFTVLAPNGRTDVYGATECIYVASEFDPKAHFQENELSFEKYLIHVETPVGLQFVGMVKEISVFDAAIKWARELGIPSAEVTRDSAIAVLDTEHGERDGKLRFTVLTAGRTAGSYLPTWSVYVATNARTHDIFRMATEPTKEREEFTVQDLKDAVNKLKANAIKPDKDGYYRWRVDAAGNIELVSEAEKQEAAKDTGVYTWTGMRVFERLNIPGFTCHEGIWQALSDEQRARCESIARAINRNSAPRSGLLTGELLYKSLQKANDDLEIKIKDPLCAWEMLTPPPRKYYENAASLLSKELSTDRKSEPIDDLATRRAMCEKAERDSVMVRNFKEALSALKDRRDFLSEKGFVQFLISNEHAMQIVLEAEKQEPEPIDHDFTAAKEVRPAESTLLRIWLAKDEANLNKQMDGMSGNWPGVGGPYCFDVEIGDGDATIVGGDPDPLYRGEIAAVSKTNKHGAGIRIRRDAQEDYIYIFPSLGSYPKEDAVGELKIELKEFVVDKPCRYLVRSLDEESMHKRVGIVDAISFFDAADKWAAGTSGGSRIAIPIKARPSDGYLEFITAIKTDDDDVYVWGDKYLIEEFRSADGSVPEDAPKAISYNVQFTAKFDSTPDSEECRKHIEQAIVRACKERTDEQP